MSAEIESTSPAGSDEPRPRVWFVSGGFGAPAEIWLWRQITGFERLDPTLVCWERTNPTDYPIGDIPVHQLEFERRPMNQRSRWLYRLRNLPTGNFYGTQGAEKQHLAGLARDTRPQAMLCHFGHIALRLLPIAQQLSIPIIVHFHGLDASSMLRNDRWYRWSLRRALKSFDRVVVVGSQQEQWLRDEGVPPERLHRIPCGTPTDAIRPHDRPPETRHLRFAMVSRLVAWKGGDLTIQAFARVADAFPEAKLHIAGDGPDRSQLEALVSDLGLTAAVIFHGNLTPPQVAALLSDSHVLVQHSLDHESGWSEGFGVSVAEAAASGLPVVCSRCGGLQDQVLDGETGFLTPQRDVEAMARAMQKLAADPALRDELGRAGRARVLENFDTRRQIARLEEVVLDAVLSS